MMGLAATLWGVAVLGLTITGDTSRAMPLAIIAVSCSLLEVADQIRKGRKC